MSRYGFEPLDTRKRAEIVARQLLRAIRSGLLKPGDKLPPERELVGELGVSRPTLREAIGALQLLGILESRPGDGTYVLRGVDPDEIEFQAEILRSFGLGAKESALDLLEARKILEMAITDIVTERIVPKEIATLKRYVKQMREAKTPADFFAHDMAFHQCLADAGENLFLAQTMRALLEKMREPWWNEIREDFIFSNADYMQTAWTVHQEIVEALQSGDRAAALDAVRRHYDYSRWLTHVRTIAMT